MNNIANEIYLTIVKHTAWKRRLHQVVDSGKKAQDIGVDHCELGKWLREHATQLGSHPHYSLIVDLHNRLHQEADHIINLATRGKTAEAKTASEYGSEFEHLSQELVRNIIAWHDAVTGKK